MKNVNVTIIVPESLKRKMKKFREVNWSEVARRAFEEEIARIEKKIAAEEIDRLREESMVEWSGEREIRKLRDLSSTHQ